MTTSSAEGNDTTGAGTDSTGAREPTSLRPTPRSRPPPSPVRHHRRPAGTGGVVRS